jgi:hypothetical protein
MLRERFAHVFLTRSSSSGHFGRKILRPYKCFGFTVLRPTDGIDAVPTGFVFLKFRLLSFGSELYTQALYCKVLGILHALDGCTAYL